MSDFDESLNSELLLTELVVDNLLVTLSSPQFESEELTAYFNTPYRSLRLYPMDRLPRIREESDRSDGLVFSLPEKNPFVPESNGPKD